MTQEIEQPFTLVTHSAVAARAWMIDKIRDHRASGGGPVLIVWCQYGTATTNALVVASDVETMLADIDAMVKDEGVTRSDAKELVVDTLRSNKHMGEDGGRVIAQTLLWLLCRGARGELLEAIARKGDCAMGYEVTLRENGEGEYARFRAIVQPNLGM